VSIELIELHISTLTRLLLIPALKRRQPPSSLCGSLLFPLNLGNTLRGTGDAGCNLLNVAAMLKEDFDLLTEAFVGFVGRAGIRLVHVGVSAMSH
jgi:hypothetical protein